MVGFFTYVKKSILVFLILFSSIFTLQLQAEDPTNEPEVTVLAVKQDGFTASDMSKYRLVGTAGRSGSGVGIVWNGAYQAGSIFTASKIFMPNAAS